MIDIAVFILQTMILVVVAMLIGLVFAIQATDVQPTDNEERNKDE